jgi:5-methylthioribose kinase
MASIALETEENIEAYLKEKGIFPADTRLIVEDLRKVKESVEGFVNRIYRIRCSNGDSVVLKQVTDMPLSRDDELENGKPDAHLHEWSLDPARLHTEISVLIFWNSICPDICPDIRLFDEPNGIIIMEDLTDLSLLRFEFSRMQRHPELGVKLGEFFARNLFYSSKLYLTDFRYQELQNFFHNTEYNALEPFLFEECAIVSKHRTMPEGTEKLRDIIINDKIIQKEIGYLRDQFVNNKECLIHTDLHASNIMVDAERVKIIDTEFAGYGPIGQDFGRLTASFCLNFLSWYGDDETPKSIKTDYQYYLLETVETLYETFEATFTALCRENSKDSYSLKQLDTRSFLQAHFRDAMAFTALNAASRIADRGLCHDLARLPVENRVYPQLLILTLCRTMLTCKGFFFTVTDLTDYLRGIAADHPLSSF